MEKDPRIAKGRRIVLALLAVISLFVYFGPASPAFFDDRPYSSVIEEDNEPIAAAFVETVVGSSGSLAAASDR